MPNRKFEAPTLDYPFESQWFERNGVNMHYIDEGEGTPVVMCHGNPTWSFLYRNIIKELSGECRCIAYDLPGFGYSDHPPGYGYTPQEHVEWIRALLINHLKLERFIIVVQDWGGPTGLHVATTNSDRILGAVISNTWAWEVGPIFKLFSTILGGPIGRYLIIKHNLFARSMVPMVLTGETKNNKKALAAYVAPFPTEESRVGIHIFARHLNKSKPWLIELEKRLNSIADKPVEFVFGLKDLGTRPVDMKHWMSHFSNAHITKVPHANHFTQEDCPEEIVAAIKRLLRVS
jgi:haloalkane dehalogenase